MTNKTTKLNPNVPFGADPDFNALSARRAAIDVGSNSVRMLFQGKKTVEITALSEGLMTSGRLKREAAERTADAIFRLKREAEQNGAEDVFVFATEAVRAAENRSDFIALLKKGGVSLDLLSSKQEAEIGFLGAYTSGFCAVADIGGASTELTVGTKNRLIYSHSLPLGCVRLFDFSDRMEQQILYARSRMEEYGSVPSFDDLVVIGGTSSTYVALKEKLEPYDPEIVQGYRLKRSDVEEITKTLYEMPLSERRNVVGLHPKKAPTSVSSGVMLSELMRFLKRDACVVSERDNLEGYLIQLDSEQK